MDTNFYKTTDKNFLVFKNACLKYIAMFQLGKWNVRFTHGDLGTDDATCTFTVDDSMQAEIALSSKINEEVDEKVLEVLAFHEVMHLFFAELHGVISNFDGTKTQMEFLFNKEIHALVHILSAVQFSTLPQK